MSQCVSNLHSHDLAAQRCLLDTASKLGLFSVSGLKDNKLRKTQTYTKAEACKLYSRVFRIFLPNVIKIDPYNFELYCFKVCTFFGHSVIVIHFTYSPHDNGHHQWSIIVNCRRYPSLKNVRELLYKHGHGSVDGRRMPLTSNADIEKVLGMPKFRFPHDQSNPIDFEWWICRRDSFGLVTV